MASFDDIDSCAAAPSGGSTPLSSISLFHLGPKNPAGFNSFASVDSTADRPHLSFVSGCSAVYLLIPQQQQQQHARPGDVHSQYEWRVINTGSKDRQILAIAATVFDSAPDYVWLMVASLQTTPGGSTRKPHLAVLQFDRIALTSDPQAHGSIVKQETLDWCPLMAKAYRDDDHSGFLVGGSDSEIHVWVLSRHNFYSTVMYDIIAPPSIAQVSFLRHLQEARSTVLCLDYHIGKGVDLWATGTQDGWVQLWMIPGEDVSACEVLLNGPISSVTLFTVASTQGRGGDARASRHQRGGGAASRSRDELRGVLRRAAQHARRTAPVPPPDDEAAAAAAAAPTACFNLVAAEASGRVTVFWDVVRHGLSRAEMLQSPPLDRHGDAAASAAPAAAPPAAAAAASSSAPAATSAPAVVQSASCSTLSASPYATPTSAGVRSAGAAAGGAGGGGELRQRAATALHVEYGGSPRSAAAGDTPLRGLASPRRAEQQQPAGGIADGGLLGTGVLCTHASDATGDGMTELMVGTYGKAMVVYRATPSCAAAEEFDGSNSPSACSDAEAAAAAAAAAQPQQQQQRQQDQPWTYTVAYVRYFPHAVQSIQKLEPMLEPTNELHVLTSFHLHVLGPEVNQARARVQHRLDLLQQVLELEHQCEEWSGVAREKGVGGGGGGGGGVGVGGGGGGGGGEDCDTDSTSSASSSTLSDEGCGKPPPWVLDRFVLGR